MGHCFVIFVLLLHASCCCCCCCRSPRSARFVSFSRNYQHPIVSFTLLRSYLLPFQLGVSLSFLLCFCSEPDLTGRSAGDCCCLPDRQTDRQTQSVELFVPLRNERYLRWETKRAKYVVLRTYLPTCRGDATDSRQKSEIIREMPNAALECCWCCTVMLVIEMFKHQSTMPI